MVHIPNATYRILYNHQLVSTMLTNLISNECPRLVMLIQYFKIFQEKVNVSLQAVFVQGSPNPSSASSGVRVNQLEKHVPGAERYFVFSLFWKNNFGPITVIKFCLWYKAENVSYQFKEEVLCTADRLKQALFINFMIQLNML